MAYWGRSTTNGNNYAVTFRRAMGGTFGGTDQQLDAVEIYNPTSHTGTMRVAVYTGGAVDDPEGATLLEDLGVLTGGGGAAWDSKASTTNPTISASAIVWVYVHSDEASTYVVGSTSSGDAGDFQSARGRASLSSSGYDPVSTAYSPALPVLENFANFWYAFRINHSAVASGLSIPIAMRHYLDMGNN